MHLKSYGLTMKRLLPLLYILSLAGCGSPSYIYKNMDVLSIWLPKHSWMIMFSGKDVDIIQEKSSPSGDSGYFLFSNRADKFTFSFYIEPAPAGTSSAKECRDVAWSRMSPMLKSQKAASMKTGDEEERFSYEYIIPEVGGQTVNQKNWNIHYFRNGYWIDFHISKMNYVSGDDQVIWKFADKVIISE